MSGEATNTVAAEVWAPPAVHGRTFGAQGERAERLDRKQISTLEAMYAKGQAEGYTAGKAQFDAQLQQLQERINRLDTLLQLQSRPLQELDAQIEKQLVTLAITVARHVIRRELRSDPAQIVAIIRNTVALLPAAARDVRVHLHPEDATIVRERLVEPQAERAWSIVEDPIMTRGGCRVTTDVALIDARLEARIGAAISAVLGSERTDDRQPSDAKPQ